MTKKSGRSAAFLTALTGMSAARASPPDPNATSDAAAAAIIVFEIDIRCTPKDFDDRLIEPLWVRHLRPLQSRRSLNFPQALLVISSRSPAETAILLKYIAVQAARAHRMTA